MKKFYTMDSKKKAPFAKRIVKFSRLETNCRYRVLFGIIMSIICVLRGKQHMDCNKLNIKSTVYINALDRVLIFE